MRAILILLLFSIKLFATGQNAVVDKSPVFQDSLLPKVYITLSPDSLEAILSPENQLSNHHYKASFVFDNGVVRDSISSVGFRLRGNTSRKAQKKSFKISFNAFVEDQKYYGLEKLNLNGEHNDPSISRAKLCFDFLRAFEVPASRANHVELYINGDYFGLYLNVEHIDEEFTKSRFGGEGPLYKCLYGADLAYRGGEASRYDLPYYELKNRKGANDYEDLAHFIDVLNNTPDEDFVCELEKVFNIDRYLKCIVMDVLTGNWDGPNYNKNNFYLYYNPVTQLIEYIPYDLDNTFGVDFLGRDWSKRNIYNWSKGTSGRPLFDKLLKHQVLKDKYSYWLDKALQGFYKPTSLTSKVYDIKRLIQNAAERDIYRTLDYDFSISDFNNSFGYFSSEFVDQGIVDFINRRASSAADQLASYEPITSVALWHNYTIDYAKDSLTFYLSAAADSLPLKIQLFYNWDFQSAIWSEEMKLDSDKAIYSCSVPWKSGSDQVGYWFELTNSVGKKVNYPSCNMFDIVRSRKDIPLYINELMAINQNGITDEEGKAEDWFELYYDGDDFHNFKGYYVTDDVNDPFKYALTSRTIAPKSFHLFWADGDEEAGEYHTNFKLSGAGEELAIFNSAGSLIDHITFENQRPDISYGRSLDGREDWMFFDIPTPGISNSGKVNQVLEHVFKSRIYPNPFVDHLNLLADELSKLEVSTSEGRLIFESENITTINTAMWSSGLYIITLHFPSGDRKTIKAVKI